MQNNIPVVNSSVPKGWEWVLDICTEARLPELGMPARWQDTAEKNAKILINPATGKAFDPLTGEALKSVVGFIKATKGAFSMPGVETPAAARVTLYNSPEMQGNIKYGLTGRTPKSAKQVFVKLLFFFNLFNYIKISKI